MSIHNLLFNSVGKNPYFFIGSFIKSIAELSLIYFCSKRIK